MTRVCHIFAGVLGFWALVACSEGCNPSVEAKLSLGSKPKVVLGGIPSTISYSTILWNEICEGSPTDPQTKSNTTSWTIKAVALHDQHCVSVISKASSVKPWDSSHSICPGLVVGEEHISTDSGTLAEESGEIKLVIHDEGEHFIELQLSRDSTSHGGMDDSDMVAVARSGNVRVIPAGLCLLPTLAIIVAALVSRSAKDVCVCVCVVYVHVPLTYTNTYKTGMCT
jgi:hypothetical protein